MKTAEELQAELEAEREKIKSLEANKQRLIDESKGFKERAHKAEETLSDAEKAKLESNGELEKLLAKEREEKKKLLETLDNTTSSVLREKLRNEVSKFAKDAHDVDMLLKVTEHKDVLKIDEQNLTIEGAEDFVKKARETHKFMFSKKTIEETEDKKGGVDTKTSDEKYYEELAQANTRAEMDAVRKKHGKQ
jgi:hypothetical protein